MVNDPKFSTTPENVNNSYRLRYNDGFRGIRGIGAPASIGADTSTRDHMITGKGGLPAVTVGTALTTRSSPPPHAPA